MYGQFQRCSNNSSKIGLLFCSRKNTSSLFVSAKPCHQYWLKKQLLVKQTSQSHSLTCYRIRLSMILSLIPHRLALLSFVHGMTNHHLFYIRKCNIIIQKQCVEFYEQQLVSHVCFPHDCLFKDMKSKSEINCGKNMQLSQVI